MERGGERDGGKGGERGEKQERKGWKEDGRESERG